MNLNPSLWKAALRQRIAAIPAWVMVLGVSGLVGAVSATTAVMGLPRWRNRSDPALRVPVESEADMVVREGESAV